MKIRKILVGVDGTALSMARVETAFNMAAYLKASVTTLYPIHISIPIMGVGSVHGGGYMTAELLSASKEQALESATSIQDVCERVAERYDREWNWLQQEGDVVRITSAVARYYDILLQGSPDPLLTAPGYGEDLNSILLSAGSPCLVIPGVSSYFKERPKNILLTWNGSRESSQALHGAMPLLESADSVMVLTVYKGSEKKKDMKQMNKDIVSYLLTHEIKVTGHLVDKQNVTVANAITAYAEGSETDLIVMGAYGHSRFRETILGGATRDMLSDSDIPILFSH